MDLGTFSLSLAVKDLAASQAFYARLGFEPIGGDAARNWLILANGPTVIGLFQGMFEKNMLTFNPGWSGAGAEAETFTDVRELHGALAGDGVDVLHSERLEEASGPASFVIADPDGNPILIDQHR